jgi:5-(carboxyamino)imidazole ribonucleotide synthase
VLYLQYICGIMVKVGILGGGQLGRMLLQAAVNYPVVTYVLENDTQAPAAHLCHHFVLGDIRNFNDVYNFGKLVDALTIEIENVNLEALEKLESEGLAIYPKPAALRIIKNKITQKQFYKNGQIPTADFLITQNADDFLKVIKDFLPAAQKIGQGGYDGKGVKLFTDAKNVNDPFDAPSVVEKLIEIKKELAVIVACAQDGKMVTYPCVDMVFDPTLNLLDFQLSPADIKEQILWRAEAIARKVVQDLQSPGIFAVELFITHNDEVLVNETAPRVHNSGHHTIEANYCSQFDMVWRIILNYPLGNTAHIQNAAIVNIIGEVNHTGPAHYQGLEEVLKIDNAFVHLYGKAETKPGRKMGHVTILSNEKQELIHQANRIKHTLKVITK